MAEPADLILHSGKLWDGRHLDGIDAVAIASGKILATGTNAELDQFRSKRTEVIDVGGRRILPGLIDSHLHMVRAGLRWEEDIHWHDVGSLPLALERLAAGARQREPGRLLAVMGGWHPNQFEERRPATRQELDEAAPHHPVFVQRNYIEAFLNTAALEEMGWPDDGQGRVSGLVPLQQLRARLPSPDHESGVTGTISILNELRRWGLTGCIDAGGFGMSPPAYAAIDELAASGDLGFRVRLLVGASQPGGEASQLEEWMSLTEPGQGDDQLRHLGAGEVLIFGAHDMEGLDDRDISPIADELAELSGRLAEAGWPIHIHAILDSSMSTILAVWEKTVNRTDLSELRFTITHADQVGEANLRHIRDLGLGLTVQNGMAFRSGDSVPTWGEERPRHAPPLRTMLDLGIPLGAGTDGTVVSSPNPWRCIAWMVTGHPLDGSDPRVPEQRLTVEEALRLYTSGSAWFSFEEESRGNLRPGSHADLIVLSEDPLTVSEQRLGEITSALTMVGGAVLHSDLGL